MLQLLVCSFLWLTGFGSGVPLPASSEVLDGGGGGWSDGGRLFLDWSAMSYQVSLSYILVIPTEHILVLV